MKHEIKRVSCDPICGFMVQSHNEKEVVDMAMKHVKGAHPDMNFSKNDAMGMMKTVKGKI